MSWRIAFVKRSLPAIRNWKNSSLRREDLCRRTNSEWRWNESGARTYTPRGPCASHSKNTPRGLHTSSSLDQLVVLKLHLPQSIQSVKTKTLQDLLAAISNVRIPAPYSIYKYLVGSVGEKVVLSSFTFCASAWYNCIGQMHGWS